MLDVHLPSLEWSAPYHGVCRLHVEALVFVQHHHGLSGVVEDSWKMLVDGDHEVACGGEAHVVTYVDDGPCHA